MHQGRARTRSHRGGQAVLVGLALLSLLLLLYPDRKTWAGWCSVTGHVHTQSTMRQGGASSADGGGLLAGGVAAACKFHRTYIGAIERGEKNITLDAIERIARTLKTTPLELFRDTDASS